MNLFVKVFDFNYIFILGIFLIINLIDLCLIFLVECMKENFLLFFYFFRVVFWLLIKKGI